MANECGIKVPMNFCIIKLIQNIFTVASFQLYPPPPTRFYIKLLVFLDYNGNCKIKWLSNNYSVSSFSHFALFSRQPKQVETYFSFPPRISSIIVLYQVPFPKEFIIKLPILFCPLPDQLSDHTPPRSPVHPVAHHPQIFLKNLNEAEDNPPHLLDFSDFHCT